MNDIVNILIPFYNAEATLSKTLSSVTEQTATNWKVILIDDGSTDSSTGIAQEFFKNNPEKVILIKSSKPQSGPAVGRNAGLQQADGSYVLCLDADDSLAPFCIEQRVKIMQQHPELHWAVFNQYQCPVNDLTPLKIFNKPAKTREEAINYFLKMDVAWQTMAPIWKTETLRQLNFDEALYPSEDPDLHLRALLDDGLQLKICNDLPADCYYTVANKTGNNLLLFYSRSISSKFRWIKKTIAYLPEMVTGHTLKVYYQHLRKGYFGFIKTFLLARLRDYDKELIETTRLLAAARVLSQRDVIKIRTISKIFTSNSGFVKRLKIRGLIHKFFLAE